MACYFAKKRAGIAGICDNCENRHREFMMDVRVERINLSRICKTIRRATGFREFVEELQNNYKIHGNAAAKAASLIWRETSHVFRARYKILALAKIRLDLQKKIVKCDEMHKELRDMISWSIEFSVEDIPEINES